ncbi:MAG: transposase [Actinobacteria bacterium]|nr:transposase [Actinomycetota bacterium]
MSHSRAKLNPFGRRLLCERIAKGFPVRIAARMVGISHARAYIIWHRYLGEGEAAFELRSSRPHRSPRRTPELVMRRIERARRRRRWGPLRLSWELGLPRSTIYVVLRRLQLHRLRFFRPPRPVYRRYERPVPGDLVHIDTKKVGRVPEGGGKRFGPPRTGPGAGWEYVHVAVDDRSRVHYSERLGSERAADAAAFTARALRFFLDHDSRVRQVMTDNHWSYDHGAAFQAVLAGAGVEHVRIPRYTPRWNGKAEAFIGILLREWASPARTRATAPARSPSRTSPIRTITAVAMASSEG